MKIIAFIAAILSAATVATLTFTTVPSIQKQAADNAAAIEQLQSGIEKDIYFVVRGNYTSGEPTFYSTELHYYIPNDIDNVEDLKNFLTYNTVFLAYYVTSVNDVKITNYREQVAAGGGTYKTYVLQADFLYKPLKLYSDGGLLVGTSSGTPISSITFYGL